MLSRMNSFGLFAVMAIAFLLLFCFTTSAVYADGAAGQSPEPPPETIDGGAGQIPDPPQPAPPSGGDGDTTLTDVIVTLLFLII